MASRIFSFTDFEGKADRGEFAIGTIVIFVVFIVVGSFAGVFEAALTEVLTDPSVLLKDITRTSSVGYSAIALFLISLPPLLSLWVRRFHDLGQSGWWAILIFVPVVSLFFWIVLCLAPSLADKVSTTKLEQSSSPTSGSSGSKGG